MDPALDIAATPTGRARRAQPRRLSPSGLRFGLRGVLLATAAVGLLTGVVVYAVGWSRESEAIVREYFRVRTADAPTFALRRSFLGRSWVIANSRCRLAAASPDEVQRLAVTDDDVMRASSGELWVYPPGAWVTTPAEAVWTLVHNL